MLQTLNNLLAVVLVDPVDYITISGGVPALRDDEGTGSAGSGGLDPISELALRRRDEARIMCGNQQPGVKSQRFSPTCFASP